MPPGVSHEFMEVKRLVDFAQIVMEKSFVDVFEGPLILTSDGRHIEIWLWCGFGQELQKPARLPHLFDRILEGGRVKAHHTSDKIAQMVSGVSVVADISDTLWFEHSPANRQNTFAHRLRNPGIKAMGDDKIELSKSLGAGFTEIHRMKCDIS